MKTQTISFLSVFIAAIAVPVLVSAAGLSRSLLLNPTAIAKGNGVAVLAEETATSAPKSGMNVDANGIFISGYDPVAYFTVHKAVKGNPSIKSAISGVRSFTLHQPPPKRLSTRILPDIVHNTEASALII
jgi:hypothetical protein